MKRPGVYLAILFALSISIPAFADDDPAVDEGAQNYNQQECVDEATQNCINDACLNSDEIDCQDNCQKMSEDKCQQQVDE